MAKTLSKKVSKKRQPRVGSALLDVVTTGMYSDPLMAYREYVQNSADSIHLAREKKLLPSSGGEIHLTISGKDRSAVIEDDGVGVKQRDISLFLGGVGVSEKKGPCQRGFRGIGRLGGLAYCDVLRFETRSCKSAAVGVVEWDGA